MPNTAKFLLFMFFPFVLSPVSAEDCALGNAYNLLDKWQEKPTVKQIEPVKIKNLLETVAQKKLKFLIPVKKSSKIEYIIKNSKYKYQFVEYKGFNEFAKQIRNNINSFDVLYIDDYEILDHPSSSKVITFLLKQGKILVGSTNPRTGSQHGMILSTLTYPPKTCDILQFSQDGVAFPHEKVQSIYGLDVPLQKIE